MYDSISMQKKIKDLVSSLKESYKLSDFEALTIALKIEQNEILSRSFVLSDSNSAPTALEKIVHVIQDLKD